MQYTIRYTEGESCKQSSEVHQVRTTSFKKAENFLSFSLSLTSLFKQCLACSLLNPRTEKTSDSSMEFDLENPLTNFNESHSEVFTSLFLTESEHMPSENYFQSLKANDFDITVRRETISLISQVQIRNQMNLLIFCSLYNILNLCWFVFSALLQLGSALVLPCRQLSWSVLV